MLVLRAWGKDHFVKVLHASPVSTLLGAGTLEQCPLWNPALGNKTVP
jgi:hypothetical protein